MSGREQIREEREGRVPAVARARERSTHETPTDLAKYLIPVEDSRQAVGSVIEMILISKISMCSL